MKRIWFAIIVFVALSSCEKKISEFQFSNFVKFFGSGSFSNGFDVKELPNGYLAVGVDNTTTLNNQFFVIKTDKAGNTIWQKQFGSEFADEAYTLKVDGDNYYIGGTTTDDEGIVSSHILHLNSQGDSLGCVTISDENYSLVMNDFMIDESNIYVAGKSYESSSDYSDYFIAKYTHTGEQVWARTPPGDFNQSYKKILFNQNNELIFVGTNGAIINSSFTHITFGLINSFGSAINPSYIPAEDDQKLGDALLLQGGELLIAYNQQVQGKDEARLIKISLTDYSTIWHVQSGIPCQAKSLTLAADGTIILCGERDELIYLFKFDDYGNIVLSSPSEETDVLLGSVEAAVSTADNGLVIVGTTAPDYGTMMQLIKTDSELFLFKP